jgi:hypothetical protein
MADSEYRKRALARVRATMQSKIAHMQCKSGENIVRVLPPGDFYEDADYFIFAHVHSRIREKTLMTCNEMIFQRDYPCALAKHYREEAQKQNKPEWLKTAEHYTKQGRYYAAVWDYGATETQVKALGYSNLHHQTLSKWFVGTTVGDFTDLEMGWDIDWHQTGEKKTTRYSPQIKGQGRFEIDPVEIPLFDLREVLVFIHPDDQKAFVRKEIDELFSETFQARAFNYADYCRILNRNKIPSPRRAKEIAEDLASKKIDMWEFIAANRGIAVAEDVKADETESITIDATDLEPPAEESEGEDVPDLDEPEGELTPDEPPAEVPPDEPEDEPAPEPEPEPAPAPEPPVKPAPTPAQPKQAEIVLEPAKKAQFDQMMKDETNCFGKSRSAGDDACEACAATKYCEAYQDGRLKVDPEKKALPKVPPKVQPATTTAAPKPATSSAAPKAATSSAAPKAAGTGANALLNDMKATVNANKEARRK